MNEKEIQFHRPTYLSKKPLELNYNEFAEEMASALLALGEVQGSQKKLQNPALLIAPLSAKEAEVSSRIEGTQSTAKDVFMYDATGKSKYSDTPYVANYRNAMYQAVEELKKGRKLTPHLLESLHKTLLNRTKHKGVLGKFRTDTVWIAEKDGDPIEKAIYIPPQHYFVKDYMEDLFNYLKDGKENFLVKTGIAHYQFEAVHPFEDGNGRTGRLMIPLILYEQAKLTQPILYISGYLESHRDEYIECLHEVDKSGKLEKWLAFYFRSISEQLKETQIIIDKIYALDAEVRERFKTERSPYLHQFIEMLFETPFFTVPEAGKKIKAVRSTVLGLIDLFIQAKLIIHIPIKRERAKVYAFMPLLDILE